MQYVLTEDEYWKLKAAPVETERKMKEIIQRLCTRVAVSEKIRPSWWPPSDTREAVPWGCMFDRTSCQEVCDECPVQDDCPNPNKHWSQ